MNPLTQIRNTQKATRRERDLGLTNKASWHDKFKHSAYIYIGGLDYELTEGDLLAVFAQYGEVVDVNLIKDKQTGKSRGFAFLAYEDQRSTILAVDNLSGARVVGRIIRVEHVDDYKRKREEEEDVSEPSKVVKTEETKPKREETTTVIQSSEGKRDIEEGSLFDQLSAHLKKKRKDLPTEEPQPDRGRRQSTKRS